MKRDGDEAQADKAILLGFLLIVLGLVVATTPWWPAALALVPTGVFLGGLENLKEAMWGGFADALGWTDDDDDGID